MQDGSCKLGVWVRDDTQGLGTMTYVDGQKQYGALGHGISDVDTGLLMQIRDGKLYRASVGAVKKGEKGNPGELSGTIYYRDDQILGTITSNSETGIKGMLYAMPQELSGHSFVQTAYRQEVHTGNASIYCSIDGSVKEYTVEIEKINLSHRDINKSMVIRVKDQDLLEKTGGIVQGMSGSPILQDGKLIGAVTHVFVADMMTKIICEDYGNPSSLHMKGVEAEKYLRYAKETLARILKVEERELLFTSGGTESDNMALLMENWILTGCAGFSFLLLFIVRMLIANKAIRHFDDGISMFKLPFFEYGIIWRNLATKLRYWRADKNDFTSHKL